MENFVGEVISNILSIFECPIFENVNDDGAIAIKKVSYKSFFESMLLVFLPVSSYSLLVLFSRNCSFTRFVYCELLVIHFMSTADSLTEARIFAKFGIFELSFICQCMRLSVRRVNSINASFHGK